MRRRVLDRSRIRGALSFNMASIAFFVVAMPSASCSPRATTLAIDQPVGTARWFAHRGRLWR